MVVDRRSQWRVGIVMALVAGTVSFHYGVWFSAWSGHDGFLHAIHGRLCYIPIILAAIWFGVRGGLAAALAVTMLTLPYPRFKGITDVHLLAEEYTEMVFYFAIGLVAGILIEQQWRERRRNEQLSRELDTRRRLSSLGQMAAGLAHEIKNPLGSIQGAAEVLSDDAPRGSKKAELFNVLTRETHRLNTVVEDFLHFARPRPPRVATIDLDDVIERAVSQARIDAEKRGVRIVARYVDGGTAVDGDADQLHQVFLNVLFNAVAASPDGGEVSVSSHSSDERPGGVVEAVVSDSGPGVPPEQLDRVFDPFFSTRDCGTGLGLSISHTIVTEHGGRIAITNLRPEGAAVTIRLPIAGGS